MKNTRILDPRGAMARGILALAAVLALMVPAAAAQAHDALESNAPANGSTVAGVPAKVGLTFDHTPNAFGSEILVKDDTGTNQADGPVIIVDNHVTQKVKTGAPEGKYTVVWRIVSSDAHPIEGTFTFTATNPARDGAGVSSSGALAAASPGTASSGERPFAGIPAGVIVAAVLTLILIGLLAVFTKRRLGRPEN